MKLAIKYVLFLLIAILISLLAFLVPGMAEEGLAVPLAVTIFFTLTLLGAVWYFLSSLKAFKPGLKAAYYLLAIGIFLYSLVLAQYFVVFFVDLGENLILRNAMFLVPYGTASLFAYLGMRKFAFLLDIKSVWTSLLAVFIVAAVASWGITLLPYPQGLLETGVDEATLYSIMAVLVWSVIFGIGATAVAFQVRNVISHTYKGAMAWMAVALAALTASALTELVAKVYFFDSVYSTTDLSSLPFLLASALLLRAGLAFKETQLRSLQLPANASHADIVAATAQLVSKPSEVSQELDKFYDIVAATEGKELSAKDKTVLRSLYLHLEKYLVTREPLSQYTKESLRSGLPKEFVASLNAA